MKNTIKIKRIGIPAIIIALLIIYYLPIKVAFAVTMADEQDNNATVQISLSYQRRIFSDGVVRGNASINNVDYVYTRVPPDDLRINDIKYLKKVLRDKNYSDTAKSWFYIKITNTIDEATVYIMPEQGDVQMLMDNGTLYIAKISDMHYLTSP